MDEVSTDYNKGYQRPGSHDWNDVETNCENKKSKVLTIDPDFLDDLEIYFLCDVVRDSELNPHKIFKAVIPKKLKNGALATIHDEKSVVYRIINPEEIPKSFLPRSRPFRTEETTCWWLNPFRVWKIGAKRVSK